MNGANQKSRRVSSSMVACMSVALLSSTAAYSSVRLDMMTQLQVEGPCLASLIGPPTKSCIQWQPNVDAAATYDASRRLIFSGAADHLWHVIDIDTGKPFAEAPAIGRVVTNTVWNHDRTRMFFGTDKGALQSKDAYSFANADVFYADSKINNNLTIIDNSLLFTSTMGTIYSLDATTGAFNWKIEEPISAERLRMAQHSSLVPYEEASFGVKQSSVLVPHADGHISQVGLPGGEVIRRISLGATQGFGFPDIVAPMVMLKNRLWVSSYDLGLFSIDVGNARIRQQLPIRELVELTTDGTTLFAASANVLYAISENGEILWKYEMSKVKTRASRAGYPFDKQELGRKRIFFGSPSRLLIDKSRIIMATSLGSIGVFSKTSGRLEQIVGNSVGYGRLDWASPSSFVAVSRRGLLMKFQID